MVVVTKALLKEILKEAEEEAKAEIQRKRNLVLLIEDLRKIRLDRERRHGKTKRRKPMGQKKQVGQGPSSKRIRGKIGNKGKT